jgi:hypothetical protein
MPSGVYQRKPSQGFQKGHKVNVGKKLSLETRKKMRNSSSRFWLGKHLPEEIKKKISISKKGHSVSQETRRKLSERQKGKKLSEETKRKIGEAHWQGGTSFEPYSIDWTESLRRTIRERDKYTCQLCGKPQGDRVHSVHHINYDKKDCNPDNLITLCNSCNTKVNYNRDNWINYFKNRLR